MWQRLSRVAKQKVLIILGEVAGELLIHVAKRSRVDCVGDRRQCRTRHLLRLSDSDNAEGAHGNQDGEHDQE